MKFNKNYYHLKAMPKFNYTFLTLKVNALKPLKNCPALLLPYIQYFFFLKWSHLIHECMTT